MQSKQQTTLKEDKPQKHEINLDLFYYKKVGSRYYFRFTRLALAIIVGLTIGSIIMILGFFFLSDHYSTQEKVNVNITTPNSSYTPSQIIQPAPAPQPKPNKLPTINIPAQSSPSPPKVDEATNNASANTPSQAQFNRNGNE
jgi:hypothetical protein